MSLAENAGIGVAEMSVTFLAHREGIVIVIEVYLDESGTHEDSQVLAVSAVWAPKDVWANWTVDWDKAKGPIKVHHSVDCHNREGEWKSWSRRKRDKYVLKVLPVIRQHPIEGHFSAVDKQEVDRLLREKHDIEPPRGVLVEGYYYVCLQWALRSAWDLLHAAGHDNIAFVHETNQYAEIALSSFRHLKEKFPNRKATFGFGGKADYPPLQCADIVAFEGNRQMRDFKQPRRKPLAAIDPLGDRIGYLKYDKDEVEVLADFTADFFKRTFG